MKVTYVATSLKYNYKRDDILGIQESLANAKVARDRLARQKRILT